MLFTSESVSAGHPDKICDQISDAILDKALEQDPLSRVAVETLVKDNNVILAGEITTNAIIDYDTTVREVINNIGYNKEEYGFNANSCDITSLLGKQSSDINQGVDQKDNLGAGDQGLMFGYACNETSEYMPAPIHYAHSLVKQHNQVKDGLYDWLRPDAKSQVTFRYENDVPVEIDTVVFSTQHDPSVSYNKLYDTVMDSIILPMLPSDMIKNTKYHINPTGNFVIGGPVGDCGLTGRKIIVDTYGGMAHHGGGAFSGKDPSKVDRSAAYAARNVAKNIVANQLADKCEIQLSYAIGVSEPVSINVNTFNTGKYNDFEISELVKSTFDLTPRGIINSLDLLNTSYQPTASYGHFGRTEFPWETIINIGL